MKSGFLNARDFGVSGSEYKSAVKSIKDKKEITVENIGDFKVGDEVLALGCKVNVEGSYLFERRDRSAKNPRPWRYRTPLGSKVEIEGYDGTQGAWMVYSIDIYPENPGYFSFSKDYGLTWQTFPITDGWCDVGDGIRVKVNEFEEREWGCTAVVVYSSRLIGTIEKIDGNVITLSETANITAEGELMHSDTMGLRKAINTAIAEKKNLFIPNGRYILTDDLVIENADCITIEGESGVNTIIDYSLGANGAEDGHGACFKLLGGNDVTIKNFTLIGGLGFKDRQKGAFYGKGGSSVYGFYFNKSAAMLAKDTKRILIENCHARKMSGECFYSGGGAREFAEPADNLTREITYMRCSVEDCARNAFNNNDKAEGTSILYCRIKDVGNAAWEGASRFVKIHGCYISNTGTEIEVGNTSRVRLKPDGTVNERWDMFNKLGMAQHIITDNYFEAGGFKNEPAIRIGSFSSQVTVANNVFVNFNAPAIFAEGGVTGTNTPSENVIITGNSIDLTAIDTPSRERYGIKITTNYVTASDNHIFVRGDTDKNVRGIVISDDVVRVSVHDNTVAGCKTGIEFEKVEGTVGIVDSDTVFYRDETVYARLKPMLLRPNSHRFRGWKLIWQNDGAESEILDFDPYKLTFTLKEPRKMQTGDKFYMYGPNTIPVSVHHNIVENCETAIYNDTYAGRRAALDGNIIG